MTSDKANVEQVVAGYVEQRAARLRKGALLAAAMVMGGVALALYVDAMFGGAFAAFSGLGLIAALGQLLGVNDDPALVLLRERHDQIVWAYYETADPDRGVVFGLRSGRETRLGNAEPALLEQLRPLIPHATFGYSAETATRFALDPSSLRRRAA